jgi:hypothetical protein
MISFPKQNSDESPSSHQRWLLYFFACFVFYHRSEQSLVFLLTKLLPRLVLLLLNTFDSAYYDLFNGEFYRIESIRLLVRLIYLLNKAASQFNGCDALFATGSIEVLPDVSIRILPVLYNVLERLPEIKIIFPDLSFDDELLLADLLLRNRH